MTVILQGSLRHFAPWQLLPFLVCNVESATLEAAGVRLVLKNGRAVGSDVVAAAAAMLGADGTFTVSDSVELTAGVPVVEMEISELLEEAARYAREMAEFGDDVRFRVVDDPAMQEKISLTPEEFRLVFKIGPGRTVAELMKATGTPRRELGAVLKNLEGHGLVVRAGQGGGAPDFASNASERTVLSQPTVPPTTKVPAIVPEGATPKPELASSQADVKTVFERDPDRTVIESASPWAATPAPPPPVPRARKRTGSLTGDPPDGTVYALIDDEYTIGRESGNSIVIVDGSVSSKHALISRAQDAWSVKDLGSRNGTFVNGEQVKSKESRVLADNDIVRLGKVILTFNIAGDMSPGETTERGPGG